MAGGLMSLNHSSGDRIMNRRWYLIATLLLGFLWIGCESSEEAMRREAEARQRQEDQQRLTELTTENSSLKQQFSRLESDNSGLQARVNELEKKLEAVIGLEIHLQLILRMILQVYRI